MFHSRASNAHVFSTVIRSTGRWLSERSVNLDGTLPDPIKCRQTVKSDHDG
jgi:hypothetical protein